MHAVERGYRRRGAEVKFHPLRMNDPDCMIYAAHDNIGVEGTSHHWFLEGINVQLLGYESSVQDGRTRTQITVRFLDIESRDKCLAHADEAEHEG